MAKTTGVSCRASVMQNNCHYVNDGIYNMGSINNGNWEFTSADPTGDWIELTFPSIFMVDFIRIWESSVAEEKNLKKIELSFSNSTPQRVRMSWEMLIVRARFRYPNHSGIYSTCNSAS